MSTRYEWVDLDHPFFGVDVVEAGESVADCEDEDAHPDECGCAEEDLVPEGKVALVLSYDEVVVLVGEPARLRSFLLQAHNMLPPAPEFVPAPTDTMRPRPRR
jgi:hypothetical protein